MKIAVGSTNPVKVKAAEAVFKRVFDAELEVVSVGVESGVPAQPWGEEETVKGARNRAERALQANEGAEYGVGFEGGVLEIGGIVYECAWAAVERRDGKTCLGGGLYFELPPKMVEGIKSGKELGDVLDEQLGRTNVKQKEGAIGVLTKGYLTRQGAYEQILVQALVKFLHESWYA